MKSVKITIKINRDTTQPRHSERNIQATCTRFSACGKRAPKTPKMAAMAAKQLPSGVK